MIELHGKAKIYQDGCRCSECTEANRLNTRHSRLARAGWNEEAYEAALAEQNGCCAICGQPETRLSRWGKVWPLSADHDHRTGKRRGLLCSRCNLYLGNVNDDPLLIAAYLAYLLKHEEAA